MGALIQIVKLEPLGFRKVRGLARLTDGTCEMRDIDQPIATKEATEAAIDLQTSRHAADLSLREVAKRTGLTPEQISGLEWARYTFATEADRGVYLATLMVTVDRHEP